MGAVGRTIGSGDGVLEGLVQMDGAINLGNSGGPLADLRGGIVGINTAAVPYAQGIGFAIPINSVKESLEQLLKCGRVSSSLHRRGRRVAACYGLAADGGFGSLLRGGKSGTSR